MTNIRPYAAILGARFRMLLQYRAAAIAGLWTQIFFGLILIMIYEAFYRSSSATAADERSRRSSATSGSARRCWRCCRGTPTPRSAR